MRAASAAGLSGVHLRPQFRHHSNSSTTPTSFALSPLYASSPKLQFVSLRPQRFTISCNSGTQPGGSSSGDNESRNVVDAFFLGKALGEALSERVESTIGELLSTVGRLQAEQQKQVQDFQEEVFERAKNSKEKAAREAMEGQGIITKSSAANNTQVVISKFSPTSSSSSSSLTESNSPSTSASADTNGKSEEDL